MKIVLLIVTIAVFSCTGKKRPTSTIEARYYEGTKSDTDRYNYANFSYDTICKDLFLLAYAPDKDKLQGAANSYTEWISDFPNWSKEQSERVFKESNGFLLDTTDRDFKKYWYNDKGLLTKYENRSFSDILHTECIIIYNQNNPIAEIQLNDVVTDNLKYKNRTIQIDKKGGVLDIRHNIVEK